MSGQHLQADGASDFDKMTDIMLRLLNAAWGEGWGTFCEAFPNGRDPDNVEMPVITYMLGEMVPGVINKDGRREIKPRHRGTFRQESGGTGPRMVEVFGRVFDCQVIFEVWAENNSKATKLAKKFMNFMDMYTGYIKSQGVKEIIFRRYSNETATNSFKDNIVCRSMYYDVRLEDLMEVPADIIEKVTGIVALGDLSDDSINETIPFEIRE